MSTLPGTARSSWEFAGGLWANASLIHASIWDSSVPLLSVACDGPISARPVNGTSRSSSELTVLRDACQSHSWI